LLCLFFPQVMLQPYACRMLDILWRLSVFSLMTTLLLLMLLSLSSFDEQDKVNTAAMVGIVVINFAVLAAHVLASVREVRYWALVSWDKTKGHLTWQDVAQGVGDVLAPVCGSSRVGKMLAAKLQGLCGVQQMPQQQQQQQQRGGHVHGPPAEHAVGSVFTVHPSGQHEVREGNIMVVNPAPQPSLPQQAVAAASTSQSARRESQELSLLRM
jgi:hypothetical protein